MNDKNFHRTVKFVYVAAVAAIAINLYAVFENRHHWYAFLSLLVCFVVAWSARRTYRSERALYKAERELEKAKQELQVAVTEWDDTISDMLQKWMDEPGGHRPVD